MAGNLTAAVLSAIVPGLGQIYKGHFLRGLVFLLFFWTGIMYLLGILDAYLLDSGHVTINNTVIAPPTFKVETDDRKV
jgi:TM2 domain-containing membrane protein YozV